MRTRTLSNRLLHLRDIQLDVRLHLEVLIVCAVHLVLDVLFEVEHLAVRSFVSIHYYFC